MCGKGVVFDVYFYGIFIDGFFKLGNMEMVFCIFDEMV